MKINPNSPILEFKGNFVQVQGTTVYPEKDIPESILKIKKEVIGSSNKQKINA